VKSLDASLGLDDAAVAATKKWLFKPATRAGAPVATYVTIILEFRLSNPSQVSASDDEFSKGAYSEKTPGLVKPKLVKSAEAKYTSQAMRAKIQGTVTVDAVVLPDGTVGRARIASSLDAIYGLDAEAISAVLQWTFEPGQLNGQAVPAMVSVNVGFRLH
jgi:TonB family protein